MAMDFGGMMGGGGGMSSLAGDIGGIFQSANTAASAKKEAGMYGEAASLADQNIYIAETATKIKSLQEQRAISSTLGQNMAVAGKSGLSFGGSSLDIYKSSEEQGSLAQSMITSEGQIQENAYRAQEQSDLVMQSAAQAKEKAAQIAEVTGIFKSVMDVGSMAMMAG